MIRIASVLNFQLIHTDEVEHWVVGSDPVYECQVDSTKNPSKSSVSVRAIKLVQKYCTSN